MNSGITAPTNLAAPVIDGSDRVVKPTVPATHLKYTFYIKVTASGGSFAWFGPYDLDVGCTATSVTFTDSFTTSGVAKIVGDPTTNVYTMVSPTSSLAYCVVLTNLVKLVDGTTSHNKINDCAS